MPDDKTKTDASDRSRVAAGHDYDIERFAREHGINVDQAHNLIDRFGNDWEALRREAAKLKDVTWHLI